MIHQAETPPPPPPPPPTHTLSHSCHVVCQTLPLAYLLLPPSNGACVYLACCPTGHDSQFSTWVAWKAETTPPSGYYIDGSEREGTHAICIIYPQSSLIEEFWSYKPGNAGKRVYDRRKRLVFGSVSFTTVIQTIRIL